MKRFFNKKIIALTLPFAAAFFALPHFAHAGWLDNVFNASDFIGGLLSYSFEVLILPLAAGVLYLSGIMLDAAIQFSLHTAYIFSLSPAINLGWTIIRDICNLFFIFILIFVSLKTIVSGAGFNTGTALKNVVIAAILINFSLFITKTVVDVSNVFGNWLYTGVTKSISAPAQSGVGKGQLSNLIVERMGLVDLWTNKAKPVTDPSQNFIGRMLRLAVALIAIYIFIYAAVLFMARSITLLFLLVFSPVGFMGSVLPQVASYSKEWWDELTNAAMFPLVFLIMLYISLQFINSIDALGTAFTTATGINGATDVPGTSFKIAQYFTYFLIIFLLQTTLKTSKKYSGEMGSKLSGVADGLGKFAVNAIGTYATGGLTTGIRALGRGVGTAISTEGSLGDRYKAAQKTINTNLPPILTGDSKILKYVKAPGQGLKDLGEASVNKMKSGTWDVRNLPTGEGKAGELFSGLVAGSTGSKLDLKAPDAKAVKTQVGEWNEEKKIQKASQTILEHLDKVETRRAELEELAANNVPQTDPRYVAAKTAHDNSKLEVADQIQKLGNRELENVSKNALGNENFLQMLSPGQIKHLAGKAETDEAAAGIWKKRLSDVQKAIDTNGDVKSALRNHSDEELSNLSPETLRKPELVQSGTMDYDKFDKLVKNDKLTNETRAKMRDARYTSFYNLAQTGTPDQIEQAMAKMQAGEISKLGDKFFRDDQNNVPAVNQSAMTVLARRGNTDVLEKMVQNDTDDTTRKLMRAYIETMAQNGVQGFDRLKDWLDDTGKGAIF